MFKPKTKALQTIITISLLLTACGTKSTATPTVDPNVIFTAAAQTVEAQLTQAASSNPAPTETPAPVGPTAAPVAATAAPGTPPPANQGAGTPAVPPGATLPVLSPATPAGATPQPGAALPTLPGLPTAVATNGPVVPTATLGPSADKCQWLSNDPADGTTVNKSVAFDETWEIKNIGTTIWKKDTYMLRFFSGERLASGKRNDYPFRNDVKPGDSYKAIADMLPDKTGDKLYGNWVLSNGSQNFCWFTITLNVTK